MFLLINLGSCRTGYRIDFVAKPMILIQRIILIFYNEKLLDYFPLSFIIFEWY